MSVPRDRSAGKTGTVQTGGKRITRHLFVLQIKAKCPCRFVKDAGFGREAAAECPFAADAVFRQKLLTLKLLCCQFNPETSQRHRMDAAWQMSKGTLNDSLSLRCLRFGRPGGNPEGVVHTLPVRAITKPLPVIHSTTLLENPACNFRQQKMNISWGLIQGMSERRYN